MTRRKPTSRSVPVPVPTSAASALAPASSFLASTALSPLVAAAPDRVTTDAGNVAALLLVERALHRAGMSGPDLATLCRRPGTILALRAEVEGFAELVLGLLTAGALLPGTVQTLDAARCHSSTPFNDAVPFDWRLLVVSPDPHRRRLPETEEIARARESEESERLGRAARSGYPVIVLGEGAEVSPLTHLAAHRSLEGGGLDSAILANTMALVAGHDGTQAAEHLTLIEAAGLLLHRLSLADLSVSIRRGLTLDRTISLLQRSARRAGELAAAEAAERAEEEKDENGGGDDKDSDKDGGADGDLGSARRRGSGDLARRGGETSRSSSGRSSNTSSGQRSRSRDKDLGSEVIEPEPEGATRLTVETMAGFGAAKDWALDLKSDVELWRRGEIGWEAMSTCLLLSGPPGTGKTTFARALANSLQMPLHVASVQRWLEPGYLGDVLKRMSGAFDAAGLEAPVILFIDEADAIGQRQSSARDFADYWNALVNRMLELMDGAVRREGVIVLGATNRPEAIDPALLRSGRWERQIVISRPDRAALRGILAHHLADDLERIAAERDGSGRGDDRQPVTTDTAPHGSPSASPSCSEPSASAASLLDALSRRALGRTGADVERLVREARGRARREKRPLSRADLEAVLGASQPVRSPALRRRIALHEAGHAVVRHALRLGPVLALSIESETGGYAFSELDVSVEPEESWLMAQLAADLGGRAAEELVLGAASAGSGGSETSDLAHVTALALAMEVQLGFGAERTLTYRDSALARHLLLRGGPLSDAVEARLTVAMEEARRTLEANRARLERLAAALEQAGSLDAEEIAAILAPSAVEPPAIPPPSSPHGQPANAADATERTMGGADGAMTPPSAPPATPNLNPASTGEPEL